MDSSQTVVGYITETQWGVTPTSPEFQTLRFTGESMKIDRENVQSDEIRPDRNVSDMIQVGGSASGGINGEFSYGTYDDILESAMFGVWTENVLKNGVTPKSFSIQKKQAGGTSTTTYEKYMGMMVNTFSLNLSTKEKATVAIEFTGKDGAISNTQFGTFEDANTNEILDASNAFTLDSCLVEPAPHIASLSVEINNNLNGEGACGQAALRGITAGQCVVTGSISAYFEDKSMMDLFLAGTASGLGFTIGKVTGEKYTFAFPKVKITDLTHNSTGNNQSVMAEISWQALYDSEEDCALKITRAVA